MKLVIIRVNDFFEDSLIYNRLFFILKFIINKGKKDYLLLGDTMIVIRMNVLNNIIKQEESMKFTGIIRHVDEKGRIGIPTELRNIIGMQEDAVPLEFFVVGVTIHAHQLKDGYKINFCSIELKSPKMGTSY
ncbi:hypothetical protein [Bacillus cereus group sp. IBL03679]|uniref:hypothetical protein n=1 Tax=Bacillus cereus group sp. IBL03679 TaxID=3240095 RepID=UPI003D2F8A11